MRAEATARHEAAQGPTAWMLPPPLDELAKLIWRREVKI